MSCRQCTVTVLNPDNHVFCQTLDSCVKNVDPPFIMFTLPLGWASFRLHHVQLPARSSSTVSDRLLSTGLRRGVTAASSFSQSTSSGRTASPSQDVQLPDFCCGWPDGLEFSPGQSPGSRCYHGQLQALVENVSVFSVPVQLSHWTCYEDALYKPTFYLLTVLNKHTVTL